MKKVATKVVKTYPAFGTVMAANKGGMGSGIGKNPKVVLGREPFYPGLRGKNNTVKG